ncbi:hypothetical protein CH367_06965 [Leptospira barantonii]|uniref:Uncharacterized protein n=1 Tax=Leptospira barantonii TaxID=2023184 RepID=A0ABX4NQX4_9LEPT|nr:hypothetical protein CH367_06965 [Leptospira barantonii]
METMISRKQRISNSGNQIQVLKKFRGARHRERTTLSILLGLKNKHHLKPFQTICNTSQATKRFLLQKQSRLGTKQGTQEDDGTWIYFVISRYSYLRAELEKQNETF